MSENDDKQRNDNDNKHRNELLRGLSFLSQIAVTIVACIAIGVFLGRFLDNLLGTTPWMLLVCSLLGAAAAFKSIFDLTRRK